MISIKKIALGMLFSSFVLQASAAQRELTLNFYDREFRGLTTLGLKSEVAKTYPGLNLSETDLVRVEVVAKTYANDGNVQLRVENQFTRPVVVRGNPRNYLNPDPRTFDTVLLRNPDNNSDGVWQLYLDGRITVRKVVLWVVTPSQIGGFVKVGDFNAPKLVYGTGVIDVRRNGVAAVRVRAKDNDVSISNVYVVFGNGARVRLPALEGYLDEDRSRASRVWGGYSSYVDRIVVEATSPRLNGSRGEVEVSVSFY